MRRLQGSEYFLSSFPTGRISDSHTCLSLNPLVEPEVGFSPFRLTDDLHPMRLFSNRFVDLPQSAELSKSQFCREIARDSPTCARPIAVFPLKKNPYAFIDIVV